MFVTSLSKIHGNHLQIEMILTLFQNARPGMKVHTYNPSYSGGRDRTKLGNSHETPITTAMRQAEPKRETQSEK
jgi:hypothetical protein